MAAKRYTVPDPVLEHLLRQSGFLPTKGRVTQDDIKRAVKEYQQFHQFNAEGEEVLEPDGWAGPETERHMKQPRFCSYPDRMEIASQGRWDPSIATKLQWGVTSTPDSVPLETFKAHIQAAFDKWTAVCNLAATYTTNAKTANFILAAGKIDGPGGTLGWSYLPQGMAYTGKIDQLYDKEERFGSQINIEAVLAHEIGHGIGLPHLSAGNLLQPMYSANIRGPQPGDIAEAVGLYGAPAPKDPGTPPGTPTRRVEIVGNFEIVEAR